MKKKKIFSIGFVLISVLLVITVLVSLLTKDKVEHKYKDRMIEASSLVVECYKAIKEYKTENNIPLSEEDKFDSYMIGELWSDISTTDGILPSKLTSVNPNFAALFIKYFDQAGLKPGDEVATIFSGSFPCLNIACLCACKAFDIKPYVMASIGASSYGANLEDFTNVDMIHHLSEKGLIDDVNLASFGGYEDNGVDFDRDVKIPIRERIENYGIDFYYSGDYKHSFHDNVLYRTQLVKENCPNLKLFINVGGTSLGLGMGNTRFEDRYGLIKSEGRVAHRSYSSTMGLMDYYLNDGIDVIEMLNIKDMCLAEGMPYDFDILPNVGEGDCYYDVKYYVTLPIVSLVISIAFIVVYFLDRKELIFKQKEA